MAATGASIRARRNGMIGGRAVRERGRLQLAKEVSIPTKCRSSNGRHEDHP